MKNKHLFTIIVSQSRLLYVIRTTIVLILPAVPTILPFSLLIIWHSRLFCEFWEFDV